VRYDAIIIGSGQAGNPLSSALTERGWSVALIEKSYLGGTCINTECTPSKNYMSGYLEHNSDDSFLTNAELLQKPFSRESLLQKLYAVVARDAARSVHVN
jgi:pyruvate/2-oxoglutarate dehydrogenase complex dihydrolipoamide dehydrogenase (E3) component